MTFKLAQAAHLTGIIAFCAMTSSFASFAMAAGGGESSALSAFENVSLTVPPKKCSLLFQSVAEAKVRGTWISKKVDDLSSKLGRVKDSLVTKVVGDRSYKKLDQDLFSSVLYSLMRPDGLQTWLTENMYSLRLSKADQPIWRSYETGLGLSEYQSADNVQMALFSTHQTVAEAKSQNGFMIVLIRMESLEDGKIIGMSYGGRMIQDYYFMIDGEHYDEALDDIRKLRPRRDIDWSMVSSNGKDGVQASKVAAVFKISKGRIVLRGSSYAGHLQYKEGDVLLQHDNRYGLSVESASKWENATLYPLATAVARKIEMALMRAQNMPTIVPKESLSRLK